MLAAHRSDAFLVQGRDLVIPRLVDRSDNRTSGDLFAVLDRDCLTVERNLDALDARQRRDFLRNRVDAVLARDAWYLELFRCHSDLLHHEYDYSYHRKDDAYKVLVVSKTWSNSDTTRSRS